MQHVDDDMHVVWREAPGQHAIALVVEVEQRILDERRYFGLTEPARPEPDVEFPVDAMNIILAMTHGLLHCSRQAVGGPESDKLHRIRRVEVRR